jgi:hypothetical protein
VGQANDFLVRSLWQDIAAMEDPLPKLQKVGDELAANSGHRGCSIARALFTREISLVGLESAD